MRTAVLRNRLDPETLTETQDTQHWCKPLLGEETPAGPPGSSANPPSSQGNRLFQQNHGCRSPWSHVATPTLSWVNLAARFFDLKMGHGSVPNSPAY